MSRRYQRYQFEEIAPLIAESVGPEGVVWSVEVYLGPYSQSDQKPWRKPKDAAKFIEIRLQT